MYCQIIPEIFKLCLFSRRKSYLKGLITLVFSLNTQKDSKKKKITPKCSLIKFLNERLIVHCKY